MGVVYLARNRLLDRREVLKVLNRHMADSPGMVERFLREVRSAARLSHPNVVTAYSALQVDGLLVFAMEYVEGEDLARLVRELGPLPISHACDCAYQAANGLQHAFEQGMVHRDVKPHNLIATRVPTQEGGKVVVKVLDFGLAKMSHGEARDNSLTDSGQMLGTPHYIAPEQALDAQTADIRADIYSLGCTLYFLLTGGPPYPQGSTLQILQAHRSAPIPSVRAIRPDVPEALDAIIRRMMAKDPADRPQTPAEVSASLAPFRVAKFSSKPVVRGDGSASSADSQSVTTGVATHHETTPISTFASSDWLRTSDPGRNRPSLTRKWVVRGVVALTVSAAVALVAVLGPWSGHRQGTPDLGPIVEQPKSPDVVPSRTSEPVVPSKPADAPAPPPSWIGSLAGEVRVVSRNGQDFRFRWCPPGTVRLGSPRGEPGRTDDERPIDADFPEGFWIQETELTQAQWRAGSGKPIAGKLDEGADLPASSVSFLDAVEFAEALTQQLRESGQLPDDRKLDLPTEPEWESAARAGSSTPYYFGDDPDQLGDYAWFSANADQRPRPVGGKPPNAWGLFDTAGNLMEWCRVGDGPGPGASETEPRPHRGGSWSSLAESCRSASRKLSPASARLTFVGFRLVVVRSRRPPVSITEIVEAPPPPPPTPAIEPPKSSPRARTNTVGMRMVRIEPGRFRAGTNPEELDQLRKLFPNAPQDAFAREDPRDAEIDRPFLVADREVSVGQFRTFVTETGHVTEAEKSGGSHTFDGKRFRLDPARTWRSPGLPQGDDHPVVCVSQDDARQFAQWLSKREGRRYQLPTEVEWEYAARAGGPGLFGESSDPESLAAVANVADASYRKEHPTADCLTADDGFAQTAPIGSYRANAWGLYDMLGNVAEWCIAVGGDTQPYRGGSWLQSPRQCRPASRASGPANRRLNYLGFRLIDADASIDP